VIFAGRKVWSRAISIKTDIDLPVGLGGTSVRGRGDAQFARSLADVRFAPILLQKSVEGFGEQ